MAGALAIFGVAFAAFCVWLTVRVVNRREKWAKRTAVVLTVLMTLAYPLSVGPGQWLAEQWGIPLNVVKAFYAPLEFIVVYITPESVNAPYRAYNSWWTMDGPLRRD